MERLRNAFDMAACVTTGAAPRRVDLSPTRVEDVHTVAGLLKLYLRLLPSPLIPAPVYQKIARCLKQVRVQACAAARTLARAQRLPAGQQMDEVRRLVNDLSEYNRETLRVLVAHLALVAEHSAVNKMSADNLAVVSSG
jgi:hypothetical protein